MWNEAVLYVLNLDLIVQLEKMEWVSFVESSSYRVDNSSLQIESAAFLA